MRKQYKISAKYFLNESLRCFEDNNQKYFAVYIRLIFHRKVSKIKSHIGYMTKSDFDKFQNGCCVNAWSGAYIPTENGLKPEFEQVDNNHNTELEEITNTILLIENWTNEEYDIQAPRFDNDIRFFSTDAFTIIERYGRKADLYLFSEQIKNESVSAKYDFLEIITSSNLSLPHILKTCETLKIPFSDIIQDSNLQHWLFSYNMKSPDKSFIMWLLTDFQTSYKNNEIVNDILDLVKSDISIDICI